VPCAALCEPPTEIPPAEPGRSVLVLNVGWDTGSPQTSTQLFAGDAAVNAGYVNEQVREWYSQSSAGASGVWSAFAGGDYAIAAPHFANPADPTSCDPEQLLAEVSSRAEAAARAQGVEPDEYAVVAVTWWLLPTCGYTGYRNGRHIMFNFHNLTVHHELGHILGLAHAAGISCFDAAGNRVPLSSNCAVADRGDRYDLMGAGSGTFNAVYASQLGWLNGQVERLETGDYVRTVTLKPYTALPHGLRAVRLQDGNATLWLEYRQPIGVDSPGYTFPFSVPATPGLLVHREVRANGLPVSQLLDMTPAAGPEDAGLPIGQTWANPLGEMKVTLVSADASGATVRISSQRIAVPDVIGRTRTEASLAFENAGLVLGGSEEVIDPNCEFIGTVKSQTPAPGTRLLPGGAVSVKVGKEKKKGACN